LSTLVHREVDPLPEVIPLAAIRLEASLQEAILPEEILQEAPRGVETLGVAEEAAFSACESLPI